MKKETDTLDLMPFVLIVSVVILVLCMYFMNLVKDARAIAAGLQQCVVENRTIWQKECSK